MIALIEFLLFLGWISGVIIASGFWSTLFAVMFPFWAWYLTVEVFLQHFRIIF